MARYLLSAGLAALLCASGPAAAAPAPADPARIAAAERLLTAMHYDTQMDRIIEAVIGEVEHSIDRDLNTSLDHPLPPEVVAKIRTIADRHMRATFSGHRPELKRGTLLIYARHFTAPELERMAALQADPVMVKMQSEMPQIATETMALSQAMVATDQVGMREEVKAVVEDYMRTKGTQPAS